MHASEMKAGVTIFFPNYFQLWGRFIMASLARRSRCARVKYLFLLFRCLRTSNIYSYTAKTKLQPAARLQLKGSQLFHLVKPHRRITKLRKMANLTFYIFNEWIKPHSLQILSALLGSLQSIAHVSPAIFFEVHQKLIYLNTF